MPRPPKLRQVTAMPAVTLFKPAGLPMAGMRMVTLAVEELEAMRLKDIEDLHQEECATRMGISRATFHQVLKSARGKLTDAIMNGKAIQVEGGSFALPGGRFRCRRDGSEWTLPPGPLPGLASVSCPTCRGREVHPVPDLPAESPDVRAGGRGRGWQGPWGRPAGGPRWNGRRGQVRHMQIAGGHPLETPRATGPARPDTSDDAHIAPGSGAQQDNR